MIKNNLHGLVLTGGQSKRMGVDKSQLSYHGMPQKDWLHALLLKFCDKVFLSVREIKSDEKLPQIEDIHPFSSPINGVISALEKFPDKAWLVVSCDMPFIDEATLSHLISHRKKEVLVSCFRDNEDKYPEPMIALWEPESLPFLRNFIENDIRPRRFILSNPSNIIQIPDKKSLRNINTREEYNQALREL